MRIILVRLSALGDIVHTWPLAVAIRAARADAHLTWVVEQPMAPLVEGHPAVDAVISVATHRWRKQPLSARTRAEIATFRGRCAELQPDLTIDAQGTLKSALITRWTGAPDRVGLRRPWRREFVAGCATNRIIAGSVTHPHVVATNLELVRALGGEPPADPTSPDGQWLIEANPTSMTVRPWKTPFAVLLPGAGHARKILAETTLADVAQHLVFNGRDVVVAWGPGEERRARTIVDLAGAGVFLAPPTDLEALAGLLGSAAMVVGGDTGPVHLAASLGTPTLAVFLTTNSRRNAPMGRRVGIVSGAAPGRGPSGSATTGAMRRVTGSEICEAIDRLDNDPDYNHE